MSKTLKRRTNSKKRLVKRNKKHTNMRKTKNVKRRGGGYPNGAPAPIYYKNERDQKCTNYDVCYYRSKVGESSETEVRHKFTGLLGRGPCSVCGCKYVE